MIDVYFACKYYPNDLGLEQVRLTVEAGEMVGVFGANGSGKTTLLRAMAGLLNLSYGSIAIDGQDARFCRNISYVAESGSFFPDLTITEHREYFQSLIPAFNSRKYDLLTDFFALQQNKKLRDFSSGQQAKFEICCGLSQEVSWYLLDEPFLGKDFLSRRDFVKLLSGFLPEQASAVIATHLIAEIEPLLTRVVVLDKGRLIADKPMEEIYANNRSLSIFLRDVCGYDEKRAVKLLDSIWSEVGE